MNYAILNSGALQLSPSTEADRVWIKETVAANPDDRSFLAELLEYTGWQGNGIFTQVSPEDVGALTDSPLLTDSGYYDDDGKFVLGKKANLWFFNSYALHHFGDVMLDRGGVTFSRA